MSEAGLIEYTYRDDWRTEDPSLPSYYPQPGWRVQCAEHGHLGTPGKVHGKRSSAQMVATTHLNAAHAEAVRRWSFTRDELVDALRRRKPLAPLDGPVTILEGDAVFESMADALIEALEDGRDDA